MKSQLKKTEDRIAELTNPKGPPLFSPKTLEMYLSGLRLSTAEGVLTFTNPAGQTGVLCLKGVAKNPKSGETSESIAACHEVKPYESNANMVFQFAGGDLHRVCPQAGDCALAVAPIAEKPKE